ncbi:MAG: 50S ribosomal protein L32 [Clostridia bacterium]|nr:50S ribosomal protein L32 [Clostridia bacterium]
MYQKNRSLRKLTAPTLVKCECGAYKRPHRICPTCGTYNGRTVIEVGE